MGSSDLKFLYVQADDLMNSKFGGGGSRRIQDLDCRHDLPQEKVNVFEKCHRPYFYTQVAFKIMCLLENMFANGLISVKHTTCQHSNR